MKLFITATFKNSENKQEIESMCNLVNKAGFQDFCFIRDVEHYKKIFHDPKKLMNRVRIEISKCDALLIDMTDKSTGRAIEAGIAYTLNKKIIVIIKKGTKIKFAPTGIADIIISYDNISDILPGLIKLRKKWDK